MMTENVEKNGAWARFMHWYESYQGKRVVGMVYSIGAAVVIVGALFKIMHFPGAGAVLMIGMITDCMSFGNNAAVEIRIFIYILSDHKESGFNPILLEDVQYPRGYLRYWSVIKSEICHLVYLIALLFLPKAKDSVWV